MGLKTSIAALAVGTVAIVATSCTDAGSPLIIMQNQVPGDGCEVSSSLGDAYNPRGRIDTNAGAGYLFTPLVQNVATVESGNAHLRAVFVEGADIDISIQSGFLTDEALAALDDATRARLDSLTKFSKRFSGVVEASGGMTSFAFTVIPLELMEEFLAPGLVDGQLLELVVDVQVYGDLGGGEVTSPVFSYPIDVCKGCMKRDVGACADLSEGFVALEGGECVTLQDIPIDCCTTADSQELCPAAAPAE